MKIARNYKVLIILFLAALAAYVLVGNGRDRSLQCKIKSPPHYSGEAGAREAAYSLIDYASVQIEKDYTWKGNNFANNITDKICGGNLVTIKEDCRLIAAPRPNRL